MKSRWRLLGLGLAFSLLAACAAAPISPHLQERAAPVTFSELQASPERYRGETVILGGEVVKTVPTPEGTLLTILQTETEKEGRPKGTQTSEGRFQALYKGFLDPEVFASGRKVTVAGTVAGARTGRLFGQRYTYPFIEAEEVHLWPMPEEPAYSMYGPGPSYAPFGSPAGAGPGEGEQGRGGD